MTSEPDQDGNTATSTIFWLTEQECVAMVNAFADPAECQSITAALTDGFRRAAYKITLKKEKVAEKAARPRTVSTAIAETADRLKCSNSSIYLATKALFGSSKAMSSDEARDAIAWLDALTEKPSSKAPKPVQ